MNASSRKATMHGRSMALVLVGLLGSALLGLPQAHAASGGCGGQAQPVCDEQEVQATRTQAAERWGCPGRQLYLSTRNGGECWRCPDGYRRKATRAVHRPGACEKRGMFEFDTVDARFVRSAYGCPGGTFHQGDSCWSCPAGYEKKPFTIDTVCRPVVRGCGAGFVKAPRPFRRLAERHDLSRSRYCTSIVEASRLRGSFSSAIEAVERIAETGDAVGGFLRDMSSREGASVREALKTGSYAVAWAVLREMESFRTLALALSDQYQTVTVSTSSGVNAIAGGDLEAGLAIDILNMRAKAYTSDVQAVGAELSFGQTYSIGVWVGDVDGLEGLAQGLTAGVPVDAGLGAGGAEWFSMIGPGEPERFLGKVWFVDVGVGIGTGQYMQSYTEFVN